MISLINDLNGAELNFKIALNALSDLFKTSFNTPICVAANKASGSPTLNSLL